MWAKEFLNEIKIDQSKPTKIMCDNQSSLKIANNEEACRRTKHMTVKTHFVKDEIKKGTIDAVFIPSKEQRADFLTKALPRENFVSNRNKLRRNVCTTSTDSLEGKSRQNRDGSRPGEDQTPTNISLRKLQKHETYNRRAIKGTGYLVWETLRVKSNKQTESASSSSQENTKRSVVSTLHGVSVGLLPTLAIPIAIVTGVGIVVLGVVGYANVMNRIDDVDEKQYEIGKGLKKTSEQQIEIEKKLNTMIDSLEKLIERHNKLARDLCNELVVSMSDV
jgi:hypothetical protein